MRRCRRGSDPACAEATELAVDITVNDFAERSALLDAARLSCSVSAANCGALADLHALGFLVPRDRARSQGLRRRACTAGADSACSQSTHEEEVWVSLPSRLFLTSRSALQRPLWRLSPLLPPGQDALVVNVRVCHTDFETPTVSVLKPTGIDALDQELETEGELWDRKHRAGFPFRMTLCFVEEARIESVPAEWKEIPRVSS